MLTQFYKTTVAAETASGLDPSTSSAARLWACILCGLAAIADLFTALCTRLQNKLDSIPSGPNTDRDVSYGDADALAKGNAGGRDAEGSTAAATDDAVGKTAPSKSCRSTERDKDEAKTSEAPNKQGRCRCRCRCNGKGRCRCKGNGKCRCRCKCKDTGNGKCRCKCKGKNKAGNTNSDVYDTTPAGIMRMLAGSLCMKLALALLGGLGVKFSDSPRAMYGLPDMYRMLVAMCCGSKESSTAEGQYQESKGPGMVRLPSSSWLLKKLGDVRHDYMLKRCQHMLRRSVRRAMRHGMLRHPVIVAIDEHDIPFHARVMTMKYALFSRSKKGTIKFNRIITVYCVVDGQRITLGAEVVHRKQDQAAVVGRLLKQCSACGIRISAVLMDRGYYSTGVMATVREAGYPMLMPAVKYENIKESIKKFDAGELDAISCHAISSGDQSESFS